MSKLSTAGRVAVAVALVVCVQVLLLLVFAWSASRSAPHDLPIAAAGPAQQVQALVGGVEAAQPGAFDVTVVSDDAAAQSAVTSREVYGAIVLGQSGVTVYTASAASGAVAQALSQGIPAAVRAANPDVPVTVTDLVPSPADDPHGAGLSIAFLPLAITSLAAGAIIALLARGRLQRLVALLGYAVAAGLLCVAVLQPGLGVLTGGWAANAAVLGLVSLAIAAATCGLAVLLGPGGIGLSVLVVFFLGMPFSGVTSAWQLVPTPWGAWAQLLPLGAANTAVRSVAFFSSAGAGGALAVLGVWAIAGLLLAGLLPGRTLRHDSPDVAEVDAPREVLSPEAVAGS
ncbi:MAG: hypothetical protein U0R68_13895 [Candidatus Nanopelagicales bacterium]